MTKKRADLPRGGFMLSNASIFKRFFALIIDLFILDLFVLFPFKNLFSKLFDGINTSSFTETFNYLQNNPDIITSLSSVFFSLSLVAILYFAILQWKLNQTIGMMLMRIYVVSVSSSELAPKTESSSELAPHSNSSSELTRLSVSTKATVEDIQLSFLKSLTRNIFVIMIFPFYLLWFIEPFFIFFTKNNQRLLEKLTKTKTVQIYNLDNFSV